MEKSSTTQGNAHAMLPYSTVCGSYNGLINWSYDASHSFAKDIPGVIHLYDDSEKQKQNKTQSLPQTELRFYPPDKQSVSEVI